MHYQILVLLMKCNFLTKSKQKIILINYKIHFNIRVNLLKKSRNHIKTIIKQMKIEIVVVNKKNIIVNIFLKWKIN